MLVVFTHISQHSPQQTATAYATNLRIIPVYWLALAIKWNCVKVSIINKTNVLNLIT